MNSFFKKIFQSRIEANSSRFFLSSSFVRSVGRSASIVICYIFFPFCSHFPSVSFSCCCCSLYVIRVCGKLTILTEREPNTPEKIAEPPLVAVPANPVPTLSTCGMWYHHTTIIKIIKSNQIGNKANDYFAKSKFSFNADNTTRRKIRKKKSCENALTLT